MIQQVASPGELTTATSTTEAEAEDAADVKSSSQQLETAPDPEAFLVHKGGFLLDSGHMWFLGIATVLMLVSATFDTTATKYMNRQKLPTCDGCSSIYFQAPLFQTWTGYVGEFIFLPIYFVDNYFARKRRKERLFDFVVSATELEKPRCPKWLWILPLSLDFASTTCLNYATMLTQASTVQMLRSFNIILAFFLSAFALKNRLYVHQIAGVIFVLTGTILVGLYAMTHPDMETNYGNLQWLGIVTAVAGTSLSALQWVLEESLFRRFYCSPFEGVGWMGLYGVLLGAIVLIVGNHVGFEDVKGAFYQMCLGERESHILILFNILYVISLAINTAAGITVTKLSSSLLRTIVNAGRTVSIWVIEMVLGWSSFMILNFMGLVVIIIAMILYNYNYFFSRRAHWFGDKALRTPATCLPSKFEVPSYNSSDNNGDEIVLSHIENPKSVSTEEDRKPTTPMRRRKRTQSIHELVDIPLGEADRAAGRLPSQEEHHAVPCLNKSSDFSQGKYYEVEFAALEEEENH